MDAHDTALRVVEPLRQQIATVVERSESGTVHLTFDGGIRWHQFPDTRAFLAAMEQVDRQTIAWDADELERWGEDRIEQDRAGVRSLH